MANGDDPGPPAAPIAAVAAAGWFQRITPHRRHVVDLAIRLGSLTLLAFAGIALSRQAGIEIWPLALAYHFVRQFAAIAVLLFAGFVIVRRWWAAVLAAALAAHFIVVTAITSGASCTLPGRASSQPAATAPADAGTAHILRLLTYNVHFNHKPGPWTRQWFAGTGAEVMVLQEVSPGIARMIDTMADLYAYRLVVDGNTAKENLAILSKYPIVAHSVFRPAAGATPQIAARIAVPGMDPITLIVVHAPNPVRPVGLSHYKMFASWLEEETEGRPGPLIVAGDFNATPYTPSFQHVLAATGLVIGCLPPATFPAFAGRLGLPIDHVLVHGARLQGLRAERPTGSDHRALHAEIALP